MTYRNFMQAPGDSGMSLGSYQSLMGYSQPTQSLTGLGMTGVMGDIPNVTPVAPTSNLWDGFLQQRNVDGTISGGWGAAAIGIGQGLMNGWLGMQQLDLAKDTLAFNKDTFKKNYDAQRQATNTALADRQAARVAANPGAYQSVGDYMNQNRIA